MNEHSPIHDLEKRLNKVKEELLQAIINEESMSKLERLYLIEQHKLFDYEGYIQRPLNEKYLPILTESVKGKGGKNIIADSWPVIETDYRDRGDLILMTNELQYALECEDENDGMIEVIRDRRTKESISITYQQLESEIYDWCIKNKKIGFFFDW